MTECKYIIRGNMCRNPKYCEDKNPEFNKAVKLDKYCVYGVCDTASVF